MTQWDAIASDILREHATKVAVCCIALSMVFWLASQVKKHCWARRQSVQAACGEGSRNRASQHTHWTRRLPGKYTSLSWGMAVTAACLCASTKQLDFLFAVNLCTDAAFEEPLSCATIFLAQVNYLLLYIQADSCCCR